MNAIVYKLLLPGGTCMPDMHLKQSGFIYSACGPFTKNKEQIKKIKEAGDLIYIYQNELDKDYFLHDVAYGNFKDLTRRTAVDTILHITHLNSFW